MARRRFRRIFDMYSSAVRFLDSDHCSTASGGSHPISSSLGVNPVVEFVLLLTPSFTHASGSSVLIGHESALFHISLYCLVCYACSLIRPHVYHASYCLLYHGVSPLVLL